MLSKTPQTKEERGASGQIELKYEFKESDFGDLEIKETIIFDACDDGQNLVLEEKKETTGYGSHENKSDSSSCSYKISVQRLIELVKEYGNAE